MPGHVYQCGLGELARSFVMPRFNGPRRKTFLITGCNGFVGQHMARTLIVAGHNVVALTYGDNSELRSISKRIKIIEVNLLHPKRTYEALKGMDSDFIVHLAGQSSIPLSWKKPEYTLRVNILGTLNLLEIARRTDFRGQILIVGAGAEYGGSGGDSEMIRENHSFTPKSVYAVSKIGEDLLGLIYAEAYGLAVLRVRPFNLIGPGRLGGVCSDFARGVVEIEQRRAVVLNVGNLNVVRDFLDVRDFVSGLLTVLHAGEVRECYNICAGKGHRVGEILEILNGLSRVDFSVNVDKTILRKAEDKTEIGDNSKLLRLGWRPLVPFEQSIRDVLEWWRSQPPSAQRGRR